ncbi:TPA: hypothetical protein ACH3X1_004559 [Trebouxia sp. C0004]
MSKYNSEEGCPSCGEGGVSTLGGISEAARDGARNYRSEAAKLTAAELLIHWSGLNKPYTSNNIKDLDKCYDYDVGHAMLEDDKYKVGLTGTDPFGCEDYRKILYATFPLSRTDLARLSNPAQRFFPHNSIRHMTPHMIAFADAKIRSMLKGGLLGQNRLVMKRSPQWGRWYKVYRMANLTASM